MSILKKWMKQFSERFIKETWLWYILSRNSSLKCFSPAFQQWFSLTVLKKLQALNHHTAGTYLRQQLDFVSRERYSSSQEKHIYLTGDGDWEAGRPLWLLKGIRWHSLHRGLNAHIHRKRVSALVWMHGSICEHVFRAKCELVPVLRKKSTGL